MVELIPLGDAHKHALTGSASASTASASTRNFAAVIQHITSAKHMRLDRYNAPYNGAPSRVATYHVIHLADATKRYFKLFCWGDTLPTLKREDQDGEDPALLVGDIVLFSSCVFKSFRGNVDAQFTRHSSVQLLYRRGRYISTGDVKLKDFYPMIEWYKAHRHEILVASHASASSQSQDGDARPFAVIRDLRADMLANLRCTISRRAEADQQQPQPAQRLPNSSDYDGVQLCEVTVTDENNDTMVLNLWDQYADPRFVARLVTHQGNVKVYGVVVSLNTTANCLVANTTPRTEFRFTEKTPTRESSEDASEKEQPLQHFTSLAQLESASLQSDHVVLDGVAVERVLLQSFMGKADRVEPQFTPLLVECYCSVCEQTLPLVQANVVPQLYAPCKNRCRVNSGMKEREWRYRVVQLVLRDAGVGRLTVEASDAVLTRLMGNISADLLIHPQPSGDGVLPFSPHLRVAALMNALVESDSELRNGCQQLKYRVELERLAKTSDRRASLAFNDSLEDASQSLEKERYAVVALTPIVEYLW